MEIGFIRKWFKWSQVVLAMLMVQIVYTGMQLLSRIILVKGTFVFALITYRNVVAAICVAPLAYYFEIRGHVMKFSWQVWFWLFVNALNVLGTTSLFYYGLKDTTATYATNFLNLIPIVTFVVSVIIRMERLRLGSKEGKVKTIGALLCVSGALLTALYKGNEFFISNHHSDHHSPIIITPHHHWTRGTIMLLASTLAYSSWFIVQVLNSHSPILRIFIFLIFIFTGLSDLRPMFEHRLNSLEFRLESSIGYYNLVVQGPTYPPMFNPLALIFVAFLEALTLGEPITVGTLIGVVLIIFGLYSFLWGKRKEMQRVKEEAANSSANHELN
ncbi:WAT1-related protein At1g44800 [Cannabis sativa]|uniref:WAT1-related protein At1g44800 n=1 Tax=Cannabis sativa TaxID=3483 RepID=UPI0029CA32A6|nr:WAT1-related protein At1g44800 [Cannabis sativa]